MILDNSATHRDKKAAEKNGVLRTLISEAQPGVQQSGAADRLLILALWPGLGAVRRRLLRFFREDPDLLTAEVTGRLLQGIATINLDQLNWIAATLLRNVQRDMKRDLIRERMELCDPQLDNSVAVAEWPALPTRNVLSKLHRHVRPDAELVMAVAVFGFSQKEAACALGLSYDAARKRYQRVLACLAAKFHPVDL